MVQEKLVSSEKTKNDDNVYRDKPELRFPEFKDSWKIIKIEYNAIIKGRIGWKNLKSEEYTEEGPYLIAGKHINNGIINWEECDHITIERYDESPEIALKNGDIIFSKDGSLGNPALIKNLDFNATINGTMMLVRLNQKMINPNYFYQILNSDYFFRLLHLLKSGSSIPHIFQRDMINFKFPICSLEEQKKIAIFLEKIDKKIELLERKLVLYQKTINYNINEIYSNIKNYDEIKLKKIVKAYTSNLSINKLEETEGNYPLYGAEGIIKHIDFYEIETPYISIIKDGAGVGRLDLCEKFSSSLGTLQCLIPNEDIDINFLYFYLKTINFRKYVVGSTIPHIYFRDYSNEKIKVPSLIDQQDIGNYFTLLEKRNEFIKKEINSFYTFKQGLLQKMFV